MYVCDRVLGETKLASCQPSRFHAQKASPQPVFLLLAALFDALRASIHGAFAARLSRHVLARLLVCGGSMLVAVSVPTQPSLYVAETARERVRRAAPARFFSMNALSSSSSSFFSFLAAFKGLTLPPAYPPELVLALSSVIVAPQRRWTAHTFSVGTTHGVFACQLDHLAMKRAASAVDRGSKTKCLNQVAFFDFSGTEGSLGYPRTT